MRLRDKVSIGVGVVALTWCVLALGSALRWIAAIDALLVGLALVPLVTSRRGLGRSPLIITILLALVLTLLQLVPWPAGWLDALNPIGDGLRNDGASLAGVSPWDAITLDVPGTLRAIAYFVTLLGVAVIALRFAHSERGRLACLSAVAGICLVTVVVVAIHTVFDASTLYGLYTPEQASPPVLGPLLNANHLGGLCALGCAVSTGLLLYPKQSRAARIVWAVTILGTLVVVLATLSRGALLAALAGIGVTLGTYAAQRLARPVDRRARSARRRFMMTSLPIGAVALCMMTVIVFTSTGTAHQLEDTSLQEIHDPRSKYEAWRSATTLIEEAPWAGVGRGAFEPAFTRVHKASSFLTFSHVENEYMQAVIDWGIPGAIALALAFGWIGVVALRRWRDGPLAAAGLGGLATVLVQSNVDFGVELLGLAVPVTIVAATLTYTYVRPLRSKLVAPVAVLRLALIGLLGIVAYTMFSPMTSTVEEDHDLLDEHPSDDVVREELARHPLDYYGYAIDAKFELEEREPDVIPLLNHSLELHPNHTGLHRFAGRILLALDHVDQAALEYSSALEGITDPRNIIYEIDHSFPANKAAEAIPTDYDSLDLIVTALTKDGHRDIALQWIRRVVEQRPRDLTAIDMLYMLAADAGDDTLAERAVRNRIAVIWSPHAALQLAQILLRRHADSEVLTLLANVQDWHGRIEDQGEAWLALCDAKLALHDVDGATKCLHRLDIEGLLVGEREEIKRRLDEIERERKQQDLLEHYQTGTPDVVLPGQHLPKTKPPPSTP
ncbi:MAG TPA: O-antigen ligase family protein [Acidimicrobiia bacterium]|jgi:O-antigen ligase|nr:O-antigen ligase family protein [Acidimicrobiia bacterium]